MTELSLPLMLFIPLATSDVVLETQDLVSRHLKTHF